MMNISAIDVGFMYVKGIINGKRVMMKAVIGNSKPLWSDIDSDIEKDTDHIRTRVGAQEYFVSDLAIEQSDSVIHSLKDDRFNSSATDVLVKSAFALGFGSGNVDTAVVSGLPVDHMNRYSGEITELFKANGKVHDYAVVNNKNLIKGSARVSDMKLMSQPAGALADRVLNMRGEIEDRELAKKTVAVIDPGFGTTDIYVANCLKPIYKLMFSTRTAMNHTGSLVIDNIRDELGVSLKSYQAEKVIRTRQFKKNGVVYDMTPTIEWALKLTADELVSEIMNKWKSMHEIDHILLSGGGGSVLAPWITPEFPNIEVLPDPQWSVVSGYYKSGVRQFG